MKNKGFIVGFDEVRGRAAWVAFRLTAISQHHSMPRPYFRDDPRLDNDGGQTRGEPAVYAGPRYDRGHMAPNYAISRLYGARAQRDTFYYTNIVPQTPRLNQLVWQRLEEIEIDDLAPALGKLWVITGPIPEDAAAAPVAFYRIWLARAASGAWRVLAFRVPQNVRGDERLDRFIVSIDTLEAATGLDFLAGLPADRQTQLESRPASAQTFGFAAHACDRARYGWRWQDRDGIHLNYRRCKPGTVN